MHGSHSVTFIAKICHQIFIDFRAIKHVTGLKHDITMTVERIDFTVTRAKRWRPLSRYTKTATN